MISEHEKACADKIARLEESLKKKKQVNYWFIEVGSAFSFLSLSLSLPLPLMETVTNHYFLLEPRMTKLSTF